MNKNLIEAFFTRSAHWDTCKFDRSKRKIDRSKRKFDRSKRKFDRYKRKFENKFKGGHNRML